MKPHPEPLLFAAKAMGVDPAACLMIGDTTIDIRTGVAAGAQTVGVLCGFGTEDELRERAPTSSCARRPTCWRSCSRRKIRSARRPVGPLPERPQGDAGAGIGGMAVTRQPPGVLSQVWFRYSA